MTTSLTPEEQAVYTELRRVAKARKTITYGDLFQTVGISHLKSRRLWGETLGNISEYVHQQGKPYISAIVCRVATGYPGGGFFAIEGIPHHLKRTAKQYSDPLTQDDKNFIDDERQGVWNHWQGDP